ncbi:MAG: M67 family metallopeptidase [Longimonas sp.]|uniref:M67 family metallopeptidase n=1 Tax=Longimonas sp. TaxID=2039626 RepID=UPI003974D2AE
MIASPNVLSAIRTHGEAGYPEEICGFLLGTVRDGTNIVTAIERVDNEQDTNRERRYLIPPNAFREAQRMAAQQGLDIVGIYHSHPDHPAQPSQTDLEQATFSGYTYAIVSVYEGAARHLTAWQLAADRSQFKEETIHTEAPA